jgi:hypothetical protein
LFKTQKILGGRAIVADAFGKNAFEGAIQPGPGYFAHRDGYNVLYGDWSTHWWGDPLQKFIWWQGINYGAQPISAFLGGDTNVVTDFMTGTDIATAIAGTEAVISDNGTVIQWHMLDLAQGIDNLSTP